MQDMEEIYKQYFSTVNKYLFCLTRSVDISEELTQETFYRAVKTIDSFKGNCKMSVWLCQIAKNLWYDELRRRQKGTVSEEEISHLATNENTEESILQKEEKLKLYHHLQKLEEKTREVMYLRITGELSFKEIGDVLNQTETWARVTFYRGKQKLKEVEENEE